MKKLMPLVLLLLGSGAGVGAGIFLRPDTAAVEAPLEDEHEPAEGHEDAAHDDDHDKVDGHGEDGNGLEYVKLNNQFVVPIVKDSAVVSLVVLALSIEVPEGSKEAVFKREPKLRDSFLQVLFDHANFGGFDGDFTDASMLGQLRAALREVAQRDIGADVIKDVLILEIARQDY